MNAKRLKSMHAALLAGLGAMLAGPAAAQGFVTPGPVWAIAKDCLARDLQLPAEGALRAMAQACAATAEDINETGERVANAAFHAARAFNRLAQADADGALRAADFERAARLGRASLDRLRNDHPSLTANAAPAPAPTGRRNRRAAAPKADPLVNPRFRFGRAYELASAYVGLALLSGSSANACGGRNNCLAAAIQILDAERDLARPFETDPNDTRYEAFTLLRGQARAALAADPERISETADFEEVIRRGDRSANPGRRQLAERAKTELVAISLAAGRAALRDKSAASQRQAITLLQRARNAGGSNFEIAAGLGDANLLLARAEQSQQLARVLFSRAAESYAEAAGFAAELRRTEGDARWLPAETQAVLGRADSYEGLVKLEAQDSLAAAGARRQFIAALEQAVALRPQSPQVQLRLARAYVADRQPDLARGAYDAAIGQLGSTGRDVSEAMLELANVLRQSAGPSADSILQVLQRARAADPASVRANLEIGRFYFDRGLGNDLNDAASAFYQVINAAGGTNGPRTPVESELRAQAHYHLSLIEARRAQTSGVLPQAVVTQAEEAARHGVSDPRYLLHACLAHIMRGGVSVSSDGGQRWCIGNDRPESLLLRGMFFLRQAQYSPPAAIAALRNSANFAFEQGLRDVGRAADPAFNRLTVYWPGATSAPPVGDLLEFGSAVVKGCSGLTTEISLGEDQERRAQAFYEFYRVFRCRAN